jgi:hypothetical protein
MTTIETLHWHSAASGPDADLTVLMWVQYADGECDWAAGWWDGDAWRYCDTCNLVSLAGGTVLYWAEPIAWYWGEDPWGANEWHWMTDSPESQECDPRDWTPVYLPPPADHLDAVLAAERERCAKMCEEVEDQAWALWQVTADPHEQGRSIGAQHCAEAIRVGPL